jgi:hypothetical protein
VRSPAIAGFEASDELTCQTRGNANKKRIERKQEGDWRMKKIFLVVAGVIQVLIAVLHVAIIWGIAADASLTDKVKDGAQIFNAAVLTTVLFFAYVSLFRRRDLLGTSLGRAVCVFIAVFYCQRAVVDAVLSGIEPIGLSLLLLVSALYVVAALPERAPRSA